MLLDRVLLKLDVTRFSGLLPSTRTAEARWRQHNARSKNGRCPCGAPATVLSAVYGGTVGKVPCESWTCPRCKGASAWAGSTPCWERDTPCPICPGGGASRSGPVGEPANRWCCPHRDSA